MNGDRLAKAKAALHALADRVPATANAEREYDLAEQAIEALAAELETYREALDGFQEKAGELTAKLIAVREEHRQAREALRAAEKALEFHHGQNDAPCAAPHGECSCTALPKVRRALAGGEQMQTEQTGTGRDEDWRGYP